MEAAIVNLQKQLLREFDGMNTNYASVQQSYASLCSDFHTQQLIEDRCYFETQNSMSQMMKILINMNQNIAEGINSAPLMEEQIREMQTSTLSGKTYDLLKKLLIQDDPTDLDKTTWTALLESEAIWEALLEQDECTSPRHPIPHLQPDPLLIR